MLSCFAISQATSWPNLSFPSSFAHSIRNISFPFKIANDKVFLSLFSVLSFYSMHDSFFPLVHFCLIAWCARREHCHSNGFVCCFGKSLQKVISVHIQATTGTQKRRSGCVIAIEQETKWDGVIKRERDCAERVRSSEKQTSKANKMDERDKEWLASYTTRRSFYFQLSVFHRKAAVEMLKGNEFVREKKCLRSEFGSKSCEILLTIFDGNNSI